MFSITFIQIKCRVTLESRKPRETTEICVLARFQTRCRTNYVRRCDVCCRCRHGPTSKQGELQLAHGCTVWQKIHIDLTGLACPIAKWIRLFVDSNLQFHKVLGSSAITRQTSGECEQSNRPTCLFNLFGGRIGGP
jgi:hypothetical protein